MVQIWYMDNERGTYQAAPQKDKWITPEYLKDVTGAECFQIDPELSEGKNRLNKLSTERGYSFQDTINVHQSKAEYEDMVQKDLGYVKEHYHAEEEIRLVLDGAAYFDVRDNKDEWIRVEVQKNDLLIIPPKLFHRFFLTQGGFVHLKRFFIDRPTWKATYRKSQDC